MIASIKKFSKSILAKILVALIALPFILWGMGDVFRSGNQNVIAEINETKISTACHFFVAIIIGCNHPCFGVSVPYHTFRQRKLLNFSCVY